MELVRNAGLRLIGRFSVDGEPPIVEEDPIISSTRSFTRR